MKTFIILFIISALITGHPALFADGVILAENSHKVNNAGGNFTFIIDPGHGGMDGGAVGISGVLEKELNLSVSLILKDLISVFGENAVLTRSDDRLLGNAEPGHRKTEDLKYRVDSVKPYESPVFISIHMNKFPDVRCRGLTVYYSGNDAKSEILGNSIRNSVIKYLQPDNNRPIKKATSALYVLDRAKCTAVLVECGFLSNPEEERLLQDDDYKKMLAMTIAAGALGFENEG